MWGEIEQLNLGNDRTVYLIGLFGTGRWYVIELMLHNIGPRAKYVKDDIRFHRGPTSMIYSGHSTMKYTSSLQHPPQITRLILDAVKSGFADLIFVYRHPLDSLLTNWIWWRTYIRDKTMIRGISYVKNSDELCAELERNYAEFEAFAAGDPEFFAAAPGQRFLSLAEFVEETELHLHTATLTLRLEDFAIDPAREFSKIAKVMSADIDLSGLRVTTPKSRPYGYLAVQEKVPRFRDLIQGLDAETKRRIEKIGYTVNPDSRK
jgi:hypothetical protein